MHNVSGDEREELMEAAFRLVGDAVILHDADGEIYDANKKVVELTGYELEELQETGIWAFTRDPPEKIKRQWACIDEGESDTITTTHINKEGTEYHVEITVTRLPKTTPVFVSVVRDITHQVALETRLKQENQQFETLFESSNDAVALVDFEGGTAIIREANEVFKRTFANGDAVAGEDIDNIVTTSANRDEARSLTDQVFSGHIEQKEITRHTDNGAREFIWQTIPITNGEETPSAGFAIYVDITERKRREQRLKRYERIIETAGDPVYTLNKDALFTFVNEQMELVTGYDASELIGEHVSIVMDEDDIEEGTNAIQAMVSGESDQETFEMGLITASGDRIACENQVKIHESNGEFKGSVGVLRDITERKEREQELIETNERLDDFAHIISHDLRNPLNVSMGHMELLGEAPSEDRIETITQSLERMDELITDVLELARLGKDALDPEPVKISTVASLCWSNVDSHDAELIVNSDQTLRVDRGQFAQLLENVIRNAIQHGGDDVVITIGDLDEPGGFYIEDNGPGFPGEPSEILEAGFTTHADGTGFGLTIIKEIVAGHNGELHVTTGTSGGARFEFRNMPISN